MYKFSRYLKMNTSWYFTLSIFNCFDAIHILVFELNIILCSQDKLHQYFKLAIVIFIIFNLNTTRNTKPLYYTSDFTVDCILVVFSLVFKIYLNGFPKSLAFKVFISITLKCINSNFVIVFVTYKITFEAVKLAIFRKICKQLLKNFWFKNSKVLC